MLRFLTAGESHGPCLTAIVEGLPAGLSLAPADVNGDLARRQRGFGSGGRMKIEKDEVEFLSGVAHGLTTGAPLALRIENLDYKNWKDRQVPRMTIPRPGHADLTGAIKYGYDDLRLSLERASARETTARVYTKVWEMAALAGFLVAREAAKAMVPRGRGTILFTGATASLRGGKGFAAFAGAKHALRALAQSMARELGPEGIHVAHVVIDGAIDTPFIRDTFPERYKLKEQEGILDPEAIAENYWRLHCQSRSAWTHELDLRPWIESW